MPPDSPAPSVLVHLGAGIGNVVFATPLLTALSNHGFAVDVWLAADYPQTADLLQPWVAVRQVFSGPVPNLKPYAHVVPAIPPFYWPRFARTFARVPAAVVRPPDALFYRDEQAYYLDFARRMGAPAVRPCAYSLPIAPAPASDVTLSTLVLAPGCKTGEMAAKRWPHFPALADCYEDVVIVGTGDDLSGFDGQPFAFPAHVRSVVDRLTLRETAEVLAAAGAVVANDSGLAHVAGAVGTTTVILFGPTPDESLGRFPDNVAVLRQGLPCEPCWFRDRFRACNRAMTCLSGLSVPAVTAELERRGFYPSPVGGGRILGG